MNRQPDPPLEFLLETTEQEYLHEGLPVLKTAFTVPVFAGLRPRARQRLNGYYQRMLRERTRYAEKTLHPAAVRAFTSALAEGRLIRPWSLVMRCTVTLADEERGLLSLYTELTERADETARGAIPPVTLRYADTFTLRDGLPEPAVRWRERRGMVRHCKSMARDAGITGPVGRTGRTFRTFRCGQSCLTPEGRTVFFQPGDIAPPERGVQEFAVAFENTEHPISTGKSIM